MHPLNTAILSTDERLERVEHWQTEFDEFLAVLQPYLLGVLAGVLIMLILSA